MAKKKTPSTSRLSAKKTDAPMMITRASEEPVVVEPIAIDRTEIARLAYTKYVARGYTHGHAVADWLSAEAELRAAQN